LNFIQLAQEYLFKTIKNEIVAYKRAVKSEKKCRLAEKPSQKEGFSAHILKYAKNK